MNEEPEKIEYREKDNSALTIIIDDEMFGDYLDEDVRKLNRKAVEYLNRVHPVNKEI